MAGRNTHSQHYSAGPPDGHVHPAKTLLLEAVHVGVSG